MFATSVRTCHAQGRVGRFLGATTSSAAPVIGLEGRPVSLHLLLADPPHLEAAGFILKGIKGIFVAIGSVIAAVLCAIIASAKGRSGLLFGILGLFFSIITLIVVIVLPSKKGAKV